MKKSLFLSTALIAGLVTINFASAATTTEQTTVATNKVAKATPAKKAPVAHTHKAKKHHHKNVDDAYSVKHFKHQPVELVKETDIILISNNAPKSNKVSIINNEGLSVAVGGTLDMQYGSVEQKDFFKQPGNLNAWSGSEDTGTVNMTTAAAGQNAVMQNGLTANGALEFKIEKQECDDMKYGGYLKLNADPSPFTKTGNSNIGKEAMIYFEGKNGRFEAGSYAGASESMSIGGNTIAKATGGIDGDWSGWVPYLAVSAGANTSDKNVILNNAFLSSPSLPYASEYAKKSNKITYYTPTYSGFQAGLSYVPDVTTTGAVTDLLDTPLVGYKNVIEAGLSYEMKQDKVLFKVAVTGQAGEARNAYIGGNSPVPTMTPTTALSVVPIEKLNAWQVGGKVEYSGFAVAGSYGDWGKSGTDKNIKTPKKAQYWTGGVSYSQDKAGVSVTYMGSQRQGAFTMDGFNYIYNNGANASAYPLGTPSATNTDGTAYFASKNKFEAVSVGLEYKVKPGLVPYLEATAFKYKSPLDTNGAGVSVSSGIDSATPTVVKNVQLNKGVVVLGGIKLNF